MKDVPIRWASHNQSNIDIQVVVPPTPLGNIRIIPFSDLLHKHTEHPKSKVTDNLPAKDGSSNNGISKYIDTALHD